MKNQMLTSIIIFLVTLILYFYAPNTYSQIYCTIILTVFVTTAILIIKQTTINDNYFSFHVLFLLSFFFVNFVYPVFLYPTDPYHFPVFKREFNHNIITKATALTMVGISSYYIGVSSVFLDKIKPIVEPKTNFNTLQLLLSTIVFALFILIVIFGGTNFLSGNFGSSSKIPSGLLALFQVSVGLLIIFLVCSKRYKGIIDFIKKFRLIFILIFIQIMLFILIGDRGPAIQIVLVLITVFTLFVKSIKLKTFIILMLFGMITLTFISYARTRSIYDEANESISLAKGFKNIKLDSFFDIGMDLIVNNRNLYVGYEIVKEDGINYGKSVFHFIFAPIPMLPGFFTEIVYNSTPDELSSARIITERNNASFGLGTNLIVDLYMAFGIIGVIILMFFLGFITTKTQYMAILSENFISIITYVFLVAYSIYLPRTMIFEPIRFVVWAIFLFYFLKGLRLLLLQLSRKKDLVKINPK